MLHLRTCLLILAAVLAATVAHAQIDVRVPADEDAVANPRPVWLRVEDVKGSYTIPHI